MDTEHPQTPSQNEHFCVSDHIWNSIHVYYVSASLNLRTTFGILDQKKKESTLSLQKTWDTIFDLIFPESRDTHSGHREDQKFRGALRSQS